MRSQRVAIQQTRPPLLAPPPPPPSQNAPACCACPPALQVWSTKGVEGVHRFLARVYRLVTELPLVDDAPTADQLRLLHQCIKKVCLGEEGEQVELCERGGTACSRHCAVLCCTVLPGATQPPTSHP